VAAVGDKVHQAVLIDGSPLCYGGRVLAVNNRGVPTRLSLGWPDGTSRTVTTMPENKLAHVPGTFHLAIECPFETGLATWP
jgi:hypothetical protein